MKEFQNSVNERKFHFDFYLWPIVSAIRSEDPGEKLINLVMRGSEIALLALIETIPIDIESEKKVLFAARNLKNVFTREHIGPLLKASRISEMATQALIELAESRPEIFERTDVNKIERELRTNWKLEMVFASLVGGHPAVLALLKKWYPKHKRERHAS